MTCSHLFYLSFVVIFIVVVVIAATFTLAASPGAAEINAISTRGRRHALQRLSSFAGP